MCRTIGVSRIDDLWAHIPADQRPKGDLKLPAPLSELELLAELNRLAAANSDCTQQTCFLGAGAYDHFIPTAVDFLAGQSPFVTAYTPYQAEASQGTLQAFYEFQTCVCELFGMDVANASLYEFSSATLEAALMAHTVNRARRVLVSAAVHPDTLAVLRTGLSQQDIELVSVPLRGGLTDLDALAKLCADGAACIIMQSPNFFGCVERLDTAAAAIHTAGGLLVACADPVSCALLKRPGDLGADIVVGEGQSLGVPMALGGPYLGLMACREPFLRKMPGRLVGRTVDAEGRTAYCLCLQTREQHIRREKATSNVCTNQGLLAMRAVVHLSLMGRRGMAQAAALCLDKAHYAAQRIAALPGFALRFDAPFFKEFVVRAPHDVPALLAHCRARGILAGVPLGRWFPEMHDCFLTAVTEKRTKCEVDALADALGSFKK